MTECATINVVAVGDSDSEVRGTLAEAEWAVQLAAGAWRLGID